MPSLTNNIEDSILVAFGNASTNLPIAETFDANAPLVEQTEHVSGGSVGYAIPDASIIAVEEGLSEGVISGRSFDQTAGSANESVSGIIVEGV